jgi:hypothetical protein
MLFFIQRLGIASPLTACGKQESEIRREPAGDYFPSPPTTYW